MRFFRRKRRDPDPPENVRIILLDDSSESEIPVDCRFVGYEGGSAVWEVIGEPRHIRAVLIDSLPAHTIIQVPLP